MCKILIFQFSSWILIDIVSFMIIFVTNRWKNNVILYAEIEFNIE